MNFPFAAVEIVFQTNHPTVSKQKISREKLARLRPSFEVFANRPTLSETPFSGQRCEPIPYLLW
jgi:hypothetical protein